MSALYRYARHLTRNERDAEDLLQDTFVKAYRFFAGYEPGTNCKAWLFRIMTNSFLKKAQRNVREFSFIENMDICLDADGPALPQRPDGMKDPEGEMLRHMVHDNVRDALAELPVDFRTVVLLADLQGFSYKEIADVMDCPVGTVMSRLFRARKALQKRLLGYAIEQGYVSGAPQPRSRPKVDTQAPASGPEEETGREGPASLDAYRERRKNARHGA